MKELTQEKTKFLSHKISFLQPQPYTPKKAKRFPTTPSSSIPLYFHCLGGDWEGRFQLIQRESAKLYIQGVPPVQVGQEVKFQNFGPSLSSSHKPQTGIIQHIQHQHGSTPWEGTTILFVGFSGFNPSIPSYHGDRRGSFSLEPGSFVVSQVTQGETCLSSENDLYVDDGRAANSSTNLLSHPEQLQNLLKVQEIVSSKISIPSSSGSTIVACHDFPINTHLSTLPVVVLAPGYGETKRDYLTLAYYFACNGFHVIRYDHTNHVGESQGAHFDISLSSMKEDFQAVTQFVRQSWPQSPVIGVASSLASRVALKAESQKPALHLLILLVGVVDVQRSVATVHQEDVFANFLNGQIQDSANILGFNVGSNFIQDALTNHFSTLATTLEDLQSLTTPVMYISAGKDAWIDGKDLQTFKQAIGGHLSKWIDVPEALHRLQENPKSARATYRQIIAFSRKQLGMLSSEDAVSEPNRVDLGQQKRQEKMLLQEQLTPKIGQQFWNDYLDHFQTVSTSPDYVQLLDHVFHALGPISSGQRFLDAGCGNGNAGLYFLQSLQQTNDQSHRISECPIRYVGLDVIPDALSRAQGHMTHAYHSLQKASSASFPLIDMSWSQVDLQHALPFADNQFDRIVSNLVIGYLSDPQEVLRELFRILAPGGRMVLSNLKPNGDFSGIYKNLVSHRGDSEQKVEARNLLNNYGKIRQAEKEGQFRFFDQTEWMKCVDSLDSRYADVYPTFGNQAYLIVVEKPFVSANIPRLPRQESTSSARSFHGTPQRFKKVA